MRRKWFGLADFNCAFGEAQATPFFHWDVCPKRIDHNDSMKVFVEILLPKKI